jgi:tRNA(Ile)-lysidine synthase TilS/MesJ
LLFLPDNQDNYWLKKLPKFELSAITVAGWEDPTSFDYTKDICRKLNIEQHIVSPKQIEAIFGLKQSLFNTLSKIDSNEKYNVHTIYFLHQFMRRGIEEKAKSMGINKIFLGLNLEDLFSSFLGFFTTGYDVLDFPQRKIGDLTFGFPLFPLTKKEIGIYVNTTAKEFSNQGPTTAFDKGPVSRGFYYYISDKLQDLWPGIEHHILAGFNKIKIGREKPKSKKCDNCKTTFLLQSREKTKEEKCEVCKLLKELNLI